MKIVIALGLVVIFLVAAVLILALTFNINNILCANTDGSVRLKNPDELFGQPFLQLPFVASGIAIDNMRGRVTSLTTVKTRLRFTARREHS
jgi:hypothetical protein